jgi:hypothetical protein
MTRPYRSLTRRDIALDSHAMAQRANHVSPMLDEVEAKSEPPSRPAVTVPLCLLATGHRFVLAGVVYQATAEELDVGGVPSRRVVYRQAADGGARQPGDRRWLPGSTEVQPCVAGTGEVAK